MRLKRGTVKAVNYKKGTLRVVLDGTGSERQTLDDVCVVCSFDRPTRLPDKGAAVIILTDDDIGSAYCIGEYYNGSGSKPKPVPSKDKWQIGGRDLTISGKHLTVGGTGAEKVKVSGKEVVLEANKVTIKTKSGSKEF